MTAAFLFFTVVALLGFLGWREWLAVQERRTLINRIIGRTPGEVRTLDAKPAERQQVTVPPEFVDFWENGDPIGS
jgi:hypothetical protein